eukprot:366414-Chlamydomonas_euryale.AAC.5
MSTARHEKAAAAAARRGSGTDASGSGNSRPSSPLRMQSTKADAPRGATPSKASRGSGSKVRVPGPSLGPEESTMFGLQRRVYLWSCGVFWFAGACLRACLHVTCAWQ